MSSGPSAQPVFAWLTAATAIGLATIALTIPTTIEQPAIVTTAAEARQLRLALSTSESQNHALRAELDRLLAARPAAPSADASGDVSAVGPGPSATEVDRSELASRITDTVSRAAAVGDTESNRAAAASLFEAFQLGADGFPVLRDAYFDAADPKARGIVLPVMMFIGGEDARDLVLGELERETDPALREHLLGLSVKYATPDHVEKLQDLYLDALSRPDLGTAQRRSLIAGLRYAKGKEAKRALLRAARDADETIRLSAIESLASRPGMRARLEKLVANESNARIRQVGECHLIVTRRGSE